MKALILVLASAMLLAACSDGPSTADAKAAVLLELGSCDRLSIINFEKVNGLADGDNTYHVAVKYTLTLNPPDPDVENPTSYAARLKSIDQHLQQAQQQAANLDKTVQDLQSKVWGYGNSSLRPDYEAASAKLDQSVALKKALDDEKANALAEPANTFVKVCPTIRPDLRSLITQEATSFQGAHPGQNAYLQGFSVDVTGDLPMVKTDNGWKAIL